MENNNNEVLESFIDFCDDMMIAEEGMSAEAATSLISTGVITAIAAGLLVYSGVKNKKFDANLEKIENILAEKNNDFIPVRKMEMRAYKAQKILNSVKRKKEITAKMNKKFHLTPTTYIKIYSYQGKEIFTVIYDSSESDYYTTRVSLGINVIDKSKEKYYSYYLAYAAKHEHVRIDDACKWAKEFLKDNELISHSVGSEISQSHSNNSY